MTVAGLLVLSASSSQAAATAVGLGTADSFVVLAGAGITNTGPTTFSGDIGSSPTLGAGGGTYTFASGVNHAGDGVTQGAKNDLDTAYSVAASQAQDFAITADLGGTTLVPGVYTSGSSIGLTGTLTLDGRGDPSSVWVFQAGSTLTAAVGSRVLLTNGAQSCNVFWQVGSSATLLTGSTFVGTILADQSITLQTSATVDGRVLARVGAVTLDTNTISRPQCPRAAPPVPAYAANVGPNA